MFHKLNQHSQQGSALIIGIFVLTVMFLLAASLIRIVGDADESVNMEVWGTRALFSANSGADAALAQLFPLSGAPATCANVSPTWTPPANALGFYNCSVTINCNTATVGSVTQYRINSLAVCQTGDCSGGGSTSTCLRVSRQVEVEARGN
ncbi:MSHA biogenesis protein MshP [Shewanella inventionis]|uniref:MSHA biogenesis protein MshP n=1 Tax=Shewanella inventionis TaxID=1738770 RepID=A0ABQ1J8K8_9GAMM|nr:MSHA biogenesis protein MshP [Shewanella inventionis]MCL1157988.1 MSHA biogenesis protein MshP [Shewanella inventionis]UAL44069.1 MSHA biogenesis protein MshP [Shewanella inventionis]GGB62738.1 MSHA biogenesis protein MshP [Shewanella inventionis]